MIYSVKECAELLAVQEPTIYRLVKTGKIKTQPYEHRTDPIRVSQDQIVDYLVNKYPILSNLKLEDVLEGDDE